jgi:hypothetical protein
MSTEWGKWLMIAGTALLLLGLLVYLFGTIPVLNKLGNLPGDIYIKKENFQLYIPITTMILLSVLITVVFRLISYFQNGSS